MNFKPLILTVALGAALSVQAAPKAKAAKKPARPAAEVQTPVENPNAIRLSDGIVAVVDNDVVTQRQLADAVADARRSLPKGTQIADSDLRNQVLGQLISQSLLVQAGKRKNIQASDAEINAALAQNPQLQHSSSARRAAADSIIATKVRQQAVMQHSRVSDAEVDHFLAQAEKQGIALPEGEPLRQYRAQHILIKADSDAAAVGAESTIRKIYTQARSGTDFGSLARQYSQDISAGNGGDLGWFPDGVMVPAFEDAVHRLQPGQISAPVRTPFGWHLIKLNEVRDAGTPEERRRNAVRQYISQQKAQQATEALLRDLQANSYINVRQ